MPNFLELLSTQRPLLSDGAMGTVLHSRGVTFDACFDQLNLTQPALVGEVHHEYIEAGANIIQTNTFGANCYKLARHGLGSRVAEVNQAGVEIARLMVQSSAKPVLVAGDVGPLGVRLAPFGRVQPDQARQAFAEQIGALVQAGVDLLIIETISDLFEIKEAVLAARQVNASKPVVASITFTRDDRTLLGDSPAKVARFLADFGADLIGVNCSGGPNQILRILKQMRAEMPGAVCSVMPNAGWPEQVGGRIMYPAPPEYFGEYALAFCEAGASLVGGCCGTTPQHIQSMSLAIAANSPGCVPENGIILTSPSEEPVSAEQPTQLAEKLAAGKFVVAVEMDPPRGLSTHKLIAGASLLAESGADVINVADSPMARMRMSPWAVCSLIQIGVGVETVLHFPTRGRSLLRVQGDLLAAHALGVRNVFVVMGDPTAIGDYPNAMDNYDLVPSGLIKLIKQGFNTGVDHAGSGLRRPTRPMQWSGRQSTSRSANWRAAPMESGSKSRACMLLDTSIGGITSAPPRASLEVRQASGPASAIAAHANAARRKASGTQRPRSRQVCGSSPKVAEAWTPTAAARPARRGRPQRSTPRSTGPDRAASHAGAEKASGHIGGLG